MSREVCGDSEEVIRGITNAHFQDDVVSPHFLEDVAASVNRLCVTDVAESISIFKRTIEKNNVVLCGYATFRHSQLKAETADYVKQNKDLRRRGFTIQIEIDPKTDNRGHAEIMPQVTRGLANYLYNYKLFTINTHLRAFS